MNVIYRKLLDGLLSANKEFAKIRLESCIVPPVLYSKNPNSMVIQLLENDYLYILNDGDIVIKPPHSPDRNIWSVNNLDDILSNSKEQPTILQYVKSVGIIGLGNIPKPNPAEIKPIITSLVDIRKTLLMKCLGINIPLELLATPNVQPTVSCFNIIKDHPNYKSFLADLFGRKNIKESYIIQGVELDKDDPTLKVELKGTQVNLEDAGRLVQALLYHPLHGFTFIGCSENFGKDGDLTQQIVLDDYVIDIYRGLNGRRAYRGTLSVKLKNLGLPENISDILEERTK